MSRLLIFGYGFTGRALAGRLGVSWTISATSRDADARGRMTDEGLHALDPADAAALAGAADAADAILIAAPPGEQGCPGLAALAPLLTCLARAEGVAGAAARDPRDRPEDDDEGAGVGREHRPAPCLVYLSTTGVYGDRGGGWVREDTPPRPISPEGHRRLAAEQGWTGRAEAAGAPLFVLRLPGIYGPGRSALDRARDGTARRWVKPGQVFSRIHVHDLADAIACALDRPQRAGVYNLCDDEPAAPADVAACACGLLGLAPPPEEPLDDAALSPMARRFWAESKRVSNARAKAALGWRPAFRTYRDGLRAVQTAEGRVETGRAG